MENLNDKPSYIKYEGPEKCVQLTIGSLVKLAAEKYSEKVAIKSLHQDVTLTYGEVFYQVDKLSTGLVALGLNKGDHIGIWLPDSYQWYISFLAIINAGFVAVPLNARYGVEEIRVTVKQSDLKALIIGHDGRHFNFYEQFSKIIPQLKLQSPGTPVECAEFPQLKFLISIAENKVKY